MKRIWIGLLLLIGLYTAATGFMYVQQRAFLYHPMPERLAENTQSFRLPFSGGTLKIWRLNPGKQNAIIYYGGNGGDVHDEADLFEQALPNHTIYLMNYRGFGGSDGEPTEQALFADALALFDHVNKQHKQIDIVGRSLGSGVAMYVAANRDLNKLVLTTPYDSILALAERKYPIFPVRWLLKDHFDSLSRVNKVTEPVLVMLAETDRLVPHSHTQKLSSAFPSDQVEIKEIAHTNHYNIVNSETYWAIVKTFLTSP